MTKNDIMPVIIPVGHMTTLAKMYAGGDTRLWMDTLSNQYHCSGCYVSDDGLLLMQHDRPGCVGDFAISVRAWMDIKQRAIDILKGDTP